MGTGIDHHAEKVIAQKINNQVVYDTTGLVQHAAVERLAAILQPIDIVRQQVAHKLTAALTGQIDHGHVRNIKHTRIVTHLVVLFNLRAVVNRHIPAGKIDQLAAIRNVFVIQGSSVGHVFLFPLNLLI